jgi:transposase
MNLTDHDLKQIDEEYLSKLKSEQLLRLSEKLLDDLRVSRDRLNQNASNSSRPSGSQAPWEEVASREKESGDAEASVNEGKEEGNVTPSESKKEEKVEQTAKGSVSKRKPGRQPGAQGSGRRLEMRVTDEVMHKATECRGCGKRFEEEVPFGTTAGKYVLDIEKRERGLEVTHVKHLYGKRLCGCGHVTQTIPMSCPQEEGWDVRLTEQHLVGPMLCSLIICLSMRMRLSRARIQELLQDWLGISLSTGCINQCITEGGRASAPLEEDIIKLVQQSELVYIDETGWKENGRLVWLWVLRTTTATLYIIGRRSWDVIADIMEEFAGWLMSDGYGQYRNYSKRLRCLAHLIRKARGLEESCHPEAAEFGEKVLETLSLFIKGVYAARGDPDIDLLTKFSSELEHLKELCEQHRHHSHDKTKKLAREFLNDWEAIWTVLAHPELPITNNAAERALRHWVISRKISSGTRNPQGSRAFTLLASVIDTCRQRDVSPWPYIADVIAARRKGDAPPPLPQSLLA